MCQFESSARLEVIDMTDENQSVIRTMQIEPVRSGHWFVQLHLLQTQPPKNIV